LEQIEIQMPRFFFHIQCGAMYPDNQGTQLPDDRGACNVALEIASQLVRDADSDLWCGDVLQIFAEDERRTSVFTVKVSLDREN